MFVCSLSNADLSCFTLVLDFTSLNAIDALSQPGVKNAPAEVVRAVADMCVNQFMTVLSAGHGLRLNI